MAAPPVAAVPPTPAPVLTGVAPVGAVRPAVYSDPRVESWDEYTHTSRPTDTFKSISQEKYTSDKYERALLMYNRRHPQPSGGIQTEPPVLRPGDPVYIPPLEILERKYPAMIPGLPPRPAPSPIGSPMAAFPPPAQPLTTAGFRIYRVRDKPETLYEIAKKEFGNGDYWGDIFRINPEVKNPNTPLPVGTVVRVPG